MEHFLFLVTYGNSYLDLLGCLLHEKNDLPIGLTGRLGRYSIDLAMDERLTTSPPLANIVRLLSVLWF